MSEEQIDLEFEVNPGDVEHASDSFDVMCRSRHIMGGEKYGPVKFLEVDSIEMALEELADLANYVRYTYIKLYLLSAQIGKALAAQAQDQITLGASAVKNPQKEGT